MCDRRHSETSRHLPSTWNPSNHTDSVIDKISDSDSDSNSNSSCDCVSLTATATQTKMPKVATRRTTSTTSNCLFRLSVTALDPRENPHTTMDK